MFGFIELILVPIAFLLALSFGVALFAFWIWMLIDCIQSKALTDGEKIGWTLAIVLTHALGALIYLLAGRKKTA